MGRACRDVIQTIGSRGPGVRACRGRSSADRRHTGPTKCELEEFNRWASPLQNNIARVVADNLVAMLGTPRVTLSPQTLSADADYRAAIEVQSFESAPGEAATLDAVWTVRRTKDGKARDGPHHRARAGAGEKLRCARRRPQPRARAPEPGHRRRRARARSFRAVGERGSRDECRMSSERSSVIRDVRCGISRIPFLVSRITSLASRIGSRSQIRRCLNRSKRRLQR